ncbi:MAG: ferredoxin family protein [Planctomycetota bacterium]|nr:ferredoxin family protein [Planctomycetota bacterium]
MAKRITAIVSQGQSQNPVKRQLEEDVVTALVFEPGIDVIVVPHLYDLRGDATGMLALQGVKGNMIVLSWLYERAARWILDRNSVSGLIGKSLIQSEADDDDEEGAESTEGTIDRVADARPVPQRHIYCLDLRCDDSATTYIEEVKRIAAENSAEVVQLMDWISGDPKPEQLDRYLHPTAATESLATSSAFAANRDTTDSVSESAPDAERHLTSPEQRRWYPVIDFSRCTNCMECIDFCLFGVYGVDQADTILVEQPDNCRKGCPACSRVCPENAIIFPQHKTPAIAGAQIEAGSLKIDLSKLFGAPETDESAAQAAVRERDEQLVMAGRNPIAVEPSPVTPQFATPQAAELPAAKDHLDDLIDELDELDL